MEKKSFNDPLISTVNSTQIPTSKAKHICRYVFLQVGKAMSSNESAAYKIMRSLDVDYVLVIFGGVIGYSGDDINKFLWMVRIAEGEHPKDIRVSSLLFSIS